MQLLRAILCSSSSTEHRAAVQISLVFANKSESDILMRRELDQLAETHPKRARILHLLSRAPDAAAIKQQESHSPHSSSNVSVEFGHVSSFVFRRHLFPPSSSNDTLTFVCGPPSMGAETFKHLLALGFNDQAIVEF